MSRKPGAVSGPALQPCDLGAGQSPPLSRSFLGSAEKVAAHHTRWLWSADVVKRRKLVTQARPKSPRGIPFPGFIPAQLLHAVCASVLNRLPSSPTFTLFKTSLSTYLESPRMKSPFQVFIFGKALPDSLKLEIILLSITSPQCVICASLETHTWNGLLFISREARGRKPNWLRTTGSPAAIPLTHLSDHARIP